MALRPRLTTVVEQISSRGAPVEPPADTRRQGLDSAGEGVAAAAPALDGPEAAAELDGAVAGALMAAELDGAALAGLLDLARAAVVAAVTEQPAPDPSADPAWQATADAFVTLRLRGCLRGCMGTLGLAVPVGRAVLHAATMAACEDPRFAPVAPAELADLRVEVSVLTPLRRLDDPGGFQPGRHGIVVVAHGQRGVLLPQVAWEMGWGAKQMLEVACEKAGLPADAWLRSSTDLFVFEAIRVAGPLLPE
jgi:AmmeMemoRadiSam system protein A